MAGKQRRICFDSFDYERNCDKISFCENLNARFSFESERDIFPAKGLTSNLPYCIILSQMYGNRKIGLLWDDASNMDTVLFLRRKNIFVAEGGQICSNRN